MFIQQPKHMATCPELITRINETTAKLWLQRLFYVHPYLETSSRLTNIGFYGVETNNRTGFCTCPFSLTSPIAA